MDDQPLDQPGSTAPTPDASAPEAAAPHRPGRARRLVASFAATALVAGAGGLGAGYAVGHQQRGTSSTTASSGAQRATTGTGPDIQSIPGYGWSAPGNGGQGGTQLPTDPDVGGGSSGAQSSDSTAQASGSQLTGLVRIVATLKYDRAKAAGTGMVLTSDGEVVTNHHVVAGATAIKVKVMSTGKTYVAKVVGTDTKADVAVLQLSGASGLSTVETDTDGVSVGEKVTAVGDANGTVDHLSAAQGTVLALRQAITTQSEGRAAGERLTGLIQVSSDVISGDSGGATYDADGEVVGMTTAASSGSSDVVGYAVPIATVLSIADDLEDGVVSSAYDYGYPAFLGVALGETGITVQRVYQNTPAATAGLVAGDRITAVGSTRVRTATQLHAAIGRLSAGDRVAVTWTDTSGASHTATVTLATGPVE